jgi:helicase
MTHPELLPRDETGEPSITTIQFEALSAGVGRGQSMLCVAPTSTGKTLVGVWGTLTWLQGGPGRQAVYLVTHKALARQKFEEMKRLVGGYLFNGDLACIVLANGDIVQDGTGAAPTRPLAAPLLIATYEKYLAMLAASGVRGDMTNLVLVCDEIQILGDATRGRCLRC